MRRFLRPMLQAIRQQWHLLLLVSTIQIVGIAFIWSACSNDPAWQDEDLHWTQLSRVLIAFSVMLVVMTVRYLRLGPYAYLLYGLALLGVLATYVLGVDVNNSRRWIRVGGVQLQPSEFMKIGLILGLARYLQYKKDVATLRGLITPFALTAIPMFAVLKAPDLGTSLLLVPILLSMVYASGGSTKHLRALFLLALVALPILYFGFLHGYQRSRVDVWLNQWVEQSDEERREREQAEGYQLTHAKIMVGSGGINGDGFGRGRVNRANLLPEKHTDFIFPVIAEEWGLLGSSLLIGLYGALIASCLGIAYRVREPFGRLIVLGVTALFTSQVFINMGMSVGLLPITGLTLPFVSYGGTATLVAYLGIGLVLSVAVHHTPVVGGEDFRAAGV
ncbi:MAG: rod shape-determining protein RodA [Planctomycetota bacterium]